MKPTIPLVPTAAVALVVGLQSAAITLNLALFARARIGMTEGETAAFQLRRLRYLCSYS